MNKQDLVAQLSTALELSKREAGEAVDTVLESIKKAVAKGEKVGIPGFGTFEARKRKARTARNPQTGAEIKVPATTVPAFKAGKEFKEAVGGKKKSAAKSGAKKKAAKKKPAKRR
ncbi:MAG: HU family DNA-binding protein [Actinomycetota bacterium]